MDVLYLNYEPNKDLEQIQAEIFNFNTGFKVTAEEIRQRYITEKTDPKYIRYAFSSDNKPLAYIQARKTQDNVIAIGYPWALPNCPEKVQEKLFDEMLEFIKDKKPREISYWIRSDWKKQIQFFKNKGFHLSTEGFCFDFDIKAMSDFQPKSNFISSKIATKNDLDILLDLALNDNHMKNAGLTKEWLTTYFTEKVLKDGHCVIVFEDNEAICASAPLVQESESEGEKHIMLRFAATRPESNYLGWELLISEIAKECFKSGWINNGPLRVYGEKGTELEKILKPLNPKSKPCYDLYIFKD